MIAVIVVVLAAMEQLVLKIKKDVEKLDHNCTEKAHRPKCKFNF